LVVTRRCLSDKLPNMPGAQPNNPLHGVTLDMMLNQLVAKYGWDELGRTIPIRCFISDPSIKSSLTFLRKTPWARAKVEDLFLHGKPRLRNESRD